MKHHHTKFCCLVCKVFRFLIMTYDLLSVSPSISSDPSGTLQLSTMLATSTVGGHHCFGVSGEHTMFYFLWQWNYRLLFTEFIKSTLILMQSLILSLYHNFWFSLIADIVPAPHMSPKHLQWFYNWSVQFLANIASCLMW